MPWEFPEYPGDWDERRKSVYRRNGHVCCNCGSTKGPFHCDHIIPLSRGGTDDLDNLQTLCEECHAQKHPHMRHSISSAWPGWYELDRRCYCQKCGEIKEVLPPNDTRFCPEDGTWLLTRVPAELVERMKVAEEERMEVAEQKSRCFIATAALGSCYAKELNILREYRDTAMDDLLGNLLKSLYYKMSPSIANYIEDKPLLRKVSREVFVKPITRIARHTLKS